MKEHDRIKAYLERYGAVSLLRKAYENGITKTDYDNDRLAEIVTDSEMENQKNTKFPYMPKISILIPAFNTDRIKLVQTINSCLNQTYGNFEICISDGGTVKNKNIIDKFFSDDSRVKYDGTLVNAGISENTNRTLFMATGDYIGLLDHDDILEPDALFEVVKKINEGYEMVYTDEDKVDEGLSHYFKPYRKPDYNKYMFLSNNYICHFTVIKRDICNKVGVFNSEFDGAQDYDYFLRCSEVTAKIGHVPRILYHWRISDSSTSANPFNKNYAFVAGKKALESYAARNNMKDVTVTELRDPGFYRLDTESKGGLTVSTMVDGEEIRRKSDYILIVNSDMIINATDMEKLLKRACITDADVVVPKIIKKNKYEYNGLAKNGHGHTVSLKGCPAWFRGPFNIAEINMNVDAAPTCGIMIRRELYDKEYFSHNYHINSMKGKYKGINMVYAPEAKIIM